MAVGSRRRSQIALCRRQKQSHSACATCARNTSLRRPVTRFTTKWTLMGHTSSGSDVPVRPSVPYVVPPQA